MSAETLKRTMESLELTLSELAAEAGLSITVLRKVAQGESPGDRTRRLIEAALGTAIWSVAVQFADDQRRRRIFGCEPERLSMRDLQRLARRLGIKYAKEKLENRAALISRIEIALRQAAEEKARRASEPPAPAPDPAALEAFHAALLACREWRCIDCGAIGTRKDNKAGRPRKCGQCGSGQLLPNIPEITKGKLLKT